MQNSRFPLELHVIKANAVQVIAMTQKSFLPDVARPIARTRKGMPEQIDTHHVLIAAVDMLHRRNAIAHLERSSTIPAVQAQ